MKNTYDYLILTEAGNKIGLGHLTRCLSLIYEFKQLKKTGKLLLRGSQIPSSVLNSIPCEYECIDWIESIQNTQQMASSASNIIIDSYHLNVSQIEFLSQSQSQIYCFDDDFRIHYPESCIIINGSVGAHTFNYSSTQKHFLGPHYQPLRPEFKAPHQFVVREKIQKVALILGGNDFGNMAQTLIPFLLKNFPNIKFEVLGAQTHLQHPQLKIHPFVSAEEFINLVLECDFCISASGQTLYELAHLGIPTLAFKVSENQTLNQRFWSKLDWAQDLGISDSPYFFENIKKAVIKISDSEFRNFLSIQGQKWIDSLGAYRIASCIFKNHTEIKISILSDENSWINSYIKQWIQSFQNPQRIEWIHSPKQMQAGDILFMLGCGQILKESELALHSQNVVIHESDLPLGKGWSPLTWQVLENKDWICSTLFEANTQVDSGAIYLKTPIYFNNEEWVHDLRNKQWLATQQLCEAFLFSYPYILKQNQRTHNSSSFYPKRRPQNSQLDLTKSILEQMPLLRVCDSERYPAFFEWKGQEYEVHIRKRN